MNHEGERTGEGGWGKAEGGTVRERIVRPATPEEKERHQQIRGEIQQELPELKR